MTGGEMTRRGFIELTGATAASIGLAGSADLGTGNSPDVDHHAVLIGPLGQRPTVDGPYLSTWDTFAFLYIDTDGGQHYLDHTMSDWVELPALLKTYTSANLPSSPPTGTLVLDTDRGIPAWFGRDHWEWPTFVDDVETSDDQVSNTTTETEVLRFEINQRALLTGRMFILRNFGIYDTAASDDAFTYRVKVGPSGFNAASGGTTVASLTTVQENVSSAPWHAISTFIVDSEGSSGVVDSHTEGRFNDTANDDHDRNTSIDTTTAEEFVATIQWNNAKAGNVARQDMSYLQQQA